MHFIYVQFAAVAEPRISVLAGYRKEISDVFGDERENISNPLKRFLSRLWRARGARFSRRENLPIRRPYPDGERVRN